MKPHVWTNGAYVIAGIILALTGQYIAGAGLAILGYCSWVGHARGGKWWYLDWAGMYISLSAIIAQNLDMWYVVLAWPFVILATMRHRFDSVPLTAVLFALAVASAVHMDVNIMYACALFGVGFILRQQVSYGDPDYDLLHGAWHVLTATGYIFLLP